MAQSNSQANRQLSEEETVLRSIFPAEVWDIILAKCNSESSVAFCGTSACFKNWLLPRRTVYLFPQVWSIVKTTYIKIHEQDILGSAAIRHFQNRLASVQDMREAKAQPRLPAEIIAFLTRSNMTSLNFRLVCKSWRDAIDTVNLKELDYIKTNPTKLFGTQDIRKWVYKQETELCSTFNFEKFEKMVLGNKCEKVSNFVRAIVITGWSPGVFSLLERIGNNVWYCNIKFDNRSYSKAIAYQNIWDTLKLLPNLKTLEIDNQNAPSEANNDAVPDNQLLQVFSVNPVKNLEKLELLVTKNLPFPFFIELLKSNSQIKSLHVVRTMSCGEYDICAVSLPKLEELSFQVFIKTELEALCQACVSRKVAKLFLTVEMDFGHYWDKPLTELCNKILRKNFVTLVVDGNKLEGLGMEVATKIRKLRTGYL